MSHSTLQTVTISPNAFVGVGKTLASSVMVLIQGKEAVLIDGMASTSDARLLAALLHETLGLTVKFVVATHYFSDHMAAFNLFPEAAIIAHRNYLKSFVAEKNRTGEEARFFREPDILVDEELTIPWAGHELYLFHNPGYTDCMINIDCPTLDLVHGGDTVVGNMVFLPYAEPRQLERAIRRLQEKRRKRLVLSHGGVYSANALENALSYLERLVGVAAAWKRSGDEHQLIVPITDCLALATEYTSDEVAYHQRNLEEISAGRWLSYARRCSQENA